MKRITIVAGFALGLAISATQLMAGSKCELAPGEAEIFYTIEDESPYIAAPEGIATDWMGNLYVSNRIGTPNNYAVSEIIWISPWGEKSVLADLGPSAPGVFGLLGLTTDWFGNVYAAFASGNENHGVWKIDCRGRKERLKGSERIVVPNDLTFDWCGNLYVTDSYPIDPYGPGLVWKYERRSRQFEPWAASPLLAPDPENDPYGFPAPGANGIAFVPPNHVYVANNEMSMILHIPILNNGNAGEVTPVAGPWDWPDIGYPGLLFAPDGLTADMEGNLYAAVPPAGFTGFPLSPVVKINTATGETEPAAGIIVVPSSLFDFPTSLTFGGWFSGRKCLYVVGPSAANFGYPGGSGPKVTKVGVGVLGLPLQ